MADPIQVCSVSINSFKDRFTDKGNLLRAAFLSSPSKAVIDYGEVKKVSDSSSNNTDNSQDNASSSSESYSYTILNAYSSVRRICEAGEQNSNSDRVSSSQSANNSEDAFTEGEIIEIDVILPNEGKTTWKLMFNGKSTNVQKAKNALLSKDFTSALSIASTGLKTDGIVALSATTYMYPRDNEKDHCPFIGNSWYAFDAGSETTSEEDMTVCIAVAPVDAKTKNRSYDTVYKAVYSILGGELKDAAKFEGGNSEDKQELKDATKRISDYLNKVFTCIGDSSKYNKFKQIREFIVKEINSKNLSYNDTASENVKSYAKVISSANSLITY